MALIYLPGRIVTVVKTVSPSTQYKRLQSDAVRFKPNQEERAANFVVIIPEDALRKVWNTLASWRERRESIQAISPRSIETHDRLGCHD